MNDKEIIKFKKAIELYINEECEKIKIIKEYEFSNNFKKEINKIFREYIGKEPHSEVK